MEVWDHDGKPYEVNSYYSLPDVAWQYELIGLTGPPGTGPYLAIVIPDVTPDEGPFIPKHVGHALVRIGGGVTPWPILLQLIELAESGADGHQDARRAVIVVIFLALALGFDVGIDGAGDDLVRAARLVLVDKRGPFAVVAHPRHEILDPRAASSGEGVASMAKVVEVEAPGTDRAHRVRPSRHLAEVAPPHRRATRPAEHQRARFGPYELGQVLFKATALRAAVPAALAPGCGPEGPTGAARRAG